MKGNYLLVFLLFAGLQLAAQNDTIVDKNILYGGEADKKLALDIYKLKEQKSPDLIVWIHGGAWRSGSKENPPLGLLGYGYALASIDFSLSTAKIFPAQVHEIKAAVRFLRANANKYGFQSGKIIIWGSSSGGHLAALVATTNNHKELDGDIGNYISTSSSVQGCIDYFGPTNFLTILNQSTPHGLNVRLPALAILLGKPVEQAATLAKLASPVFHVDAADPPMFIVHGEQDVQVPINQSIELMSAYKNKKLTVQMQFIPNAGHSDPAYFKKELLDKIDKFLKENVLK
jgi:acetyl esterase/lipase